MEDFAGTPNAAKPEYWTEFSSSCHSCHAAASINPIAKVATPEDQNSIEPYKKKSKKHTEELGVYFPFSSPIRKLSRNFYAADDQQNNWYLDNGFIPLDFMWPIAFHAE